MKAPPKTSKVFTRCLLLCTGRYFVECLFFRFAEDGVNFSLNSDDPLVCQTRIDLEQKVAINEIGLSPAEITCAVSLVFICIVP